MRTPRRKTPRGAWLPPTLQWWSRTHRPQCWGRPGSRRRADPWRCRTTGPGAPPPAQRRRPAARRGLLPTRAARWRAQPAGWGRASCTEPGRVAWGCPCPSRREGRAHPPRPASPSSPRHPRTAGDAEVNVEVAGQWHRWGVTAASASGTRAETRRHRHLRRAVQARPPRCPRAPGHPGCCWTWRQRPFPGATPRPQVLRMLLAAESLRWRWT
mmetsp:Transcript_5666/g.13759  ORF Transcript_5666/g.13759 Transcript_5666/m.13759 type:complete len:213 (+) Transcript_5666:1211-1849(+)